MGSRRPGFALVASTFLLVAACQVSAGGPSEVAHHQATTRPNPATPLLPAGHPGAPDRAAGPAPAIPGARPGGTLTVLTGHPFTPSLDPTENYYTDTIAIQSDLLVRSLTQYVYDPTSRRMTLIPDLATDLGRHNADFTVWRFTLRRGIRFEDGRYVTPADVRFGIERSFDRKTFPSGATYSNDYFLRGRTYQGPYRSPGRYPGISIHGQELTLRMARPFPDLRYWLSFPAMSPIPPGRASDPATYKNHPLATGPYKIASYSPGRSLALVSNPYWDPTTDPGRHRYVDRFMFNFVAPLDHRLVQAMLTNDQAGGTALLDGPITGRDYRLVRSREPHLLTRGWLPCTSIWYPDNRRITSPQVRRALGYALPYRAIWRAQDLIAGVTVAPASGLIPPGIPGRPTDNPLSGHPPGSTEPGRSRAILKRAGALGTRIRLPIPTDVPGARTVRKTVQAALRRGGFRPRPVNAPAATVIAMLKDSDAPVDVRLGTWCSDWPSTGSWVTDVFGSTRVTGHGSLGGNFERFANRAVDARIRAIMRLPLTRQPAAWGALARMVMHRYYPVIPTRYTPLVRMAGSRVHGFAIDSVFGEPTYKDIWLG